MRLECPPEDVTYQKFLSSGIIWANKIGEIVTRVEAEANYMGYYLAMGFKGGPCGFCGLKSGSLKRSLHLNVLFWRMRSADII